MSVLNSLDSMLLSAQSNGLLVRSLYDIMPNSTTAATSSCGYTSAQRWPNPFTVPSVAAPVTGIVFPNIKLIPSTGNPSATTMAGIEYLLGTVTANGGTGTFADGVIMPTKTIRGTSIQTATQEVYAVVTTVMVGAGSYTLTITYTDQSGNTGATATLTIPNVASVNSAFNITPHLANGDYGMQDITNITLTGTSGVIKIYGVLVLHKAMTSAQNSSSALQVPPIVMPQQQWVASAGDVISFWKLGDTGTTNIIAQLVGVGET